MKMSTPTKKTSTKKVSNDFVVEHLMAYYEYAGMLRGYCNEHFICRQRRTLSRIGQKVNFQEMKEQKMASSYAYGKLLEHLYKRQKAADDHLSDLKELNKVLTADEIQLIVETCRMLSNMGLGIDEDTCLSVCNAILSERIEEKEFVPVTRGVVRRIILENNELLKLMRGNSIDPKRVRQADDNTLQSTFVKLENYVKILHRQGKIKWSSFAEVPAENMSNMDELSTNVHNHRKKVIASSTHLGRLFQEVNGGDSKMPFHISVCVTSKPTGRLSLFQY